MKVSHSISCFAAGLLAFSAFLPSQCAAADSKAATNASGTWKWKLELQNGQTVEPTLKLKVDGDKLTGAIMGRNGNETPIQGGTIKDDELSFTVVRERDGVKMSSKYSGNVSGDTITGKVETERDGQTEARHWLAKRETAVVAGTWKWSFEVPNGPTFEPSVKLNQDGEKLTGTLSMGENERPISDGTFKDGEVNFKVLSKRDDRTVTSTYHGKMSGDIIKGKWDSDWTGDVVARDWEANRVKE